MIESGHYNLYTVVKTLPEEIGLVDFIKKLYAFLVRWRVCKHDFVYRENDVKIKMRCKKCGRNYDILKTIEAFDFDKIEFKRDKIKLNCFVTNFVATRIESILVDLCPEEYSTKVFYYYVENCYDDVLRRHALVYQMHIQECDF